jgi:hypothetical protein
VRRILERLKKSERELRLAVDSGEEARAEVKASSLVAAARTSTAPEWLVR